jgi:osmotically inducible lipoprotein OsmB
MPLIRAVALATLILTVGCGQHPETRATSGGLLGAGGGLALGVATGGIGPAIGAVVGGGAGAVGGATTAKRANPRQSVTCAYPSRVCH